jgi:hypothetical protein
MPDRGATPAEEILDVLDTWHDEATARIPAAYVAELREGMVDRNPTVRMSEGELTRLRQACRG